ncbi:hypothetical protein ACP4OV_004706 [Aristida adscensionis]
MESKGAEGALTAAAAEAASPAPQTTAAEEEARKSMLIQDNLLPGRRPSPRPPTMPAWLRWDGVKSKVRAAGAHAVLRTRQGITMLGEPELGLGIIVKGSDKDESQKQ